jgi:Asp-tRNA(Asn)/Glu-tRNA(Gln) amidotransferase A subunit family amidase
MPYMDATELAALIRSKQLSPVEVAQSHLDRIEVVNPKLKAIVTLVAEQALEAAKAAEAAVMAGAELGPLHGVPFTAKDASLRGDNGRHSRSTCSQKNRRTRLATCQRGPCCRPTTKRR